MGGKTRWEYLRAIHPRYRAATREQRGVMLDEFCSNCGYNRKYAIRLLNGPPPGARPPRRRPRGSRTRYGSQLLSVLTEVWEAAGCPWSRRLKALLPLWMPAIRAHYHLPLQLERQLLAISARQIGGPGTYITDRVVDNHILALRKKIEPDPQHPRYLVSVRGLGYRFDG